MLGAEREELGGGERPPRIDELVKNSRSNTLNTNQAVDSTSLKIRRVNDVRDFFYEYDDDSRKQDAKETAYIERREALGDVYCREHGEFFPGGSECTECERERNEERGYALMKL